MVQSRYTELITLHFPHCGIASLAQVSTMGLCPLLSFKLFGTECDTHTYTNTPTFEEKNKTPSLIQFIFLFFRLNLFQSQLQKTNKNRRFPPKKNNIALFNDSFRFFSPSGSEVPRSLRRSLPTNPKRSATSLPDLARERPKRCVWGVRKALTSSQAFFRIQTRCLLGCL